MTLQSTRPLISVIIPNHNGAAFLEGCLRSVLSQTYTNFELVFVDNASKDNSREIVARLAPQAICLSEVRNLGFAGGVNAGLGVAHGDWIAVLNNDTEAARDWLAECVHAMERHPEADFLASRILYFKERDRIYSAGDCFLRTGIGYRRGQDRKDGPDYRMETEIFAPCGCAALYRRSVLEEARGYDARFFAYLEDVELALRLQAAGRHGWYVPSAVVYHYGGATSGGEFSPLAVRLRTRNSLLLPIKSLPAFILVRACLRIGAAQFSWFVRVLAHRRIWSYLRGLAGAVALLPGMWAERRKLGSLWRQSGPMLWRAIVRSELQARKDFVPAAGAATSTFLRWYFRLP
jgi:GT2 family glycosyltransferase